MDAVLFDLFGTLVPNLPNAYWRKTYHDVAQFLEVDSETFMTEWDKLFEHRMVGKFQRVEDQVRATLAAFGASASEASLARAAQMKHAFLLTALQPKEDAVHCLQELRARGFKLALVTDCSWETPDLLNNTPLGAFFSVRAASAHLGVRKPHAKMYEHAVTGLNVDPRRCFYVGDGNSEELVGAKRHGMTTVWVDNGGTQYFKDGWKPGGDHSVTALKDVVKLADAHRKT
jgi:putative hydrolase of the HAD superfamily